MGLRSRLMWVAWPAFLGACALELVVFAAVDPTELHWHGWPRQAIYTAAFFAFWAICAGASALTALLGMPPGELNRSP